MDELDTCAVPQGVRLSASPLDDENNVMPTVCGRQKYTRSVRVVLKYRHCDGNICMKVTDDAVCLQYKTDQAQDVKKIEKLHGKLMRLMVSKESHSGAMETD
ncbi:hypothetical protein cypCar_00002636 [Cyprinus carpio]|nr:hypothetical protein cypCar_00002636 [Cyprinus carpio]